MALESFRCPPDIEVILIPITGGDKMTSGESSRLLVHAREKALANYSCWSAILDVRSMRSRKQYFTGASSIVGCALAHERDLIMSFARRGRIQNHHMWSARQVQTVGIPSRKLW